MCSHFPIFLPSLLPQYEQECIQEELGMVIHNCNPSTGAVEAGGSQVQGQLGKDLVSEKQNKKFLIIKKRERILPKTQNTL
jgi:hypothetical protein